MKAQKAKRLLNLLADAIFGIAPEYGRPAVFIKNDKWNQHTLAWDGPFDWTMILAGSSLFAGDLGAYERPTESRIQAAMNTIEAEGGLLEPINNCWIGLHDA